jgi:hypothetical protein
MEAADFSGVLVSVCHHYEQKLGAVEVLGESTDDRICEQI